MGGVDDGLRYGYSREFSVEDHRLSPVKNEDDYMKLVPGHKSMYYEIESMFFIKRGNSESSFIDKELLEARVHIGRQMELHMMLSYRLKDYRMTEDQIDEFVNDAFLFGQNIASADADCRVFRIHGKLEVTTFVQSEDLPCMGVRAQTMIPMSLWPFCRAGDALRNVPNPASLFTITKLPRMMIDSTMYDQKVECASEQCGDMGNLYVGDPFVRLPRCGHMFHPRCMAEKLCVQPLCPKCLIPVFDAVTGQLLLQEVIEKEDRILEDEVIEKKEEEIGEDVD